MKSAGSIIGKICIQTSARSSLNFFIHKSCPLQHTAKRAVTLRNKATVYLIKKLNIMAYNILKIPHHDFAFFIFSCNPFIRFPAVFAYVRAFSFYHYYLLCFFHIMHMRYDVINCTCFCTKYLKYPFIYYMAYFFAFYIRIRNILLLAQFIHIKLLQRE